MVRFSLICNTPAEFSSDRRIYMSDTPEVNAAKLTAIYIKMRNKRAELAKQFEVEDSAIEEQQKLVSQMLLDICKQTNADSIRTAYGTVSRTMKTRYWTSDWHSFYEFMAKHNAFDLLEQRLHQTHMKQFLTDNPDLLPPGLNADSEYAISVRKAK